MKSITTYRSLVINLFVVFALSGCVMPLKAVFYQAPTGGDSTALRFENESPFATVAVIHYHDSKTCKPSDVDFMELSEKSTDMPPERTYDTRVKTDQRFTFKLTGVLPSSNIYLTKMVCAEIYSFTPQKGYSYIAKLAAHDRQCDVNLFRAENSKEAKDFVPDSSIVKRQLPQGFISTDACGPEKD